MPSKPTAPPRVAIYARVSKGEQNPEYQAEQLRGFVSRSDWTLSLEFIDRKTGTTLQRPAFVAMMQAADRREFDCLVFWKLDRLARSGILDTLETLRKLRAAGIDYHSFTEPHIRSGGLLAELHIAFLATIAEVERNSISERTRAALSYAQAQGKKLGRPARIADRIRLTELRAAGLSYPEIAAATGISRATVIRRLSEQQPSAAGDR